MGGERLKRETAGRASRDLEGGIVGSPDSHPDEATPTRMCITRPWRMSGDDLNDAVPNATMRASDKKSAICCQAVRPEETELIQG